MNSTYRYESKYRKATVEIEATKREIIIKIDCTPRGSWPDNEAMTNWMRASIMEHAKPDEQRPLRLVMGEEMEVLIK